MTDSNPVQELVNQQADDAGLWFEAQTAPEAYLQKALRQLHAAIEGTDYLGYPLKASPIRDKETGK